MVVDYGYDGIKIDIFRGFCGYKFYDVLIVLGIVDLIVDVDFSYLWRMV